MVTKTQHTDTALQIAWWCVKAPFVLTRALIRGIVRLGGSVALATQDSVTCCGCGGEVSLVARFQCSWCGYVFDGFAFSRCEVCGAVPPFIECQTCGAGFRNPTLFP